jgi:hypothetical protein
VHSEWRPYAARPYPRTIEVWEKRMTDLLYLAGGVAVLLLFAGYAVLLRRA